MEWYDDVNYVLWKDNLLKKLISIKDSKRVGKLLGLVHKAFHKKKNFEKLFINDSTFYSIRIEPYLLFTSKSYPELSKQYKNTIEFLTKNKTTVIHGDFSPKNILIGKNYPIILDAETACWGNPFFDLAFLNNHLILKSILNKDIIKAYIKTSKAFLESYFAIFSSINNKAFIKKFITLQALLVLARVDGKSPVEYFNKKHKSIARNLAKSIIEKKITTFNDFFINWENVIKS